METLVVELVVELIEIWNKKGRCLRNTMIILSLTALHPYKVSILKITFCFFLSNRRQLFYSFQSHKMSMTWYGGTVIVFSVLISTECFIICVANALNIYNFRFLESLLWQSKANLLSSAQSCDCRFVSGRRWANSFCN